MTDGYRQQYDFVSLERAGVMKSVAMIAYDFPPEGNAGACRPLRFVRHLPSAGWSPTVITHDAPFFERYDLLLLAEVPAEVEIIRVRSSDPWFALQQRRAMRKRRKAAVASRLKAARLRETHQARIRSFAREILRAAEAWCYHPDMAAGWIRPAVNAAVKACNQKRTAILWATAGPVSSFIVAQRVSAQTQIPYVLDFRDAWTITYNEFEARRPAWAVRRDRQNMYELLKGAQAVIFRYWTEAECFWRAYPGALQASKIHIIPNGYAGTIDEFTPPKRDRCEILYTGTLSDYRYGSLLQALSLMKRSSPELAKQLHFTFIGEGTQALAAHAAALDLSDTVTTGAPVSQHEATKLTKKAHALLILGRPATMRGYELFAGAKLFGYLKTGMPIVGVLPCDETKRILLQAGVSTIADVESHSDIIGVLRKLVAAWSREELPSLLPDRSACERYSAERQTGDLVRALEGSPATEPFVPGSADIPASLRAEIETRSHEAGIRRPLSARQEAMASSRM